MFQASQQRFGTRGYKYITLGRTFQLQRLVIQATIEFDADDWDDITAFLADKHGITSLEDILDHFHFNREYWYMHVRIYPPPAAKGGENIAAVRELVLASPPLKAGLDSKA